MAKGAVILMNLGTPSAPTKQAYRRFLKQFLSDPRVVEIPRPIWWPILNLFILPFRPNRMAAAYQQIWDEKDGAPLAAITRRQSSALADMLQAELGDGAPLVTYAMNYGEPSLTSRIAELEAQGAERFFILPLYPQYSATTMASIYDQFARIIRRSRNIPDLHINKSYFDHPRYLDALAQSVRDFQQREGAAERLLMSFHGIPQRCVDLGDPYLDHCQQTAQAVASRLQLAPEQWAMSFQSRLGKATWLQPYTVDVVSQWARDGVKTVDVLCPAFAADCLETLEEIAIEARQLFRDCGGDDLRLIPCLNDRRDHIELFAAIVRERSGL